MAQVTFPNGSRIINAARFGRYGCNGVEVIRGGYQVAIFNEYESIYTNLFAAQLWAADGSRGHQCDFGHECAEVRVLPTGEDSNAILCHYHYLAEMRWRKDRNNEVENLYSLPAWDDLKAWEPE